ncbi:hypothetical protein L917_00906, partial [Phytophthora nicotianae]
LNVSESKLHHNRSANATWITAYHRSGTLPQYGGKASLMN